MAAAVAARTNEGRTDDMNEEYMKKAVKKIKVEFNLTQHHVDAINELLEKFREYESDGRRPFGNYTFDDVCRSIFMIGSYHTTDRHIKEAQFQMNMITVDQLISEMKTVAEWKEEEQRQQAQERGA